MNSCRTLTTLALVLLLLAPVAWAQNDEDAQTPTELTRLLPEGGLGEGIDFYLLMNSPLGDESMFLRWTIRPDGDTIDCTVQSGGGDGEFSYHSNKQLIYSKAGKLLTYRSVDNFGGNVTTRTGKVEDGKLIIKAVNEINDEDFAEFEQPGSESDEIDLKDLDGMIPMQWLPLVFGYHIREGNLGYSLKMFDNLEYNGTTTMAVEDNGTEMIEFNGKKHKAHSLLLTSNTEFEPDEEIDIEGPGEVKMRMRVLEDGTIFSMTMTEGEFEMNAKRATAEEVAEQMKQNKQAVPEEAVDAEVEDTAEE